MFYCNTKEEFLAELNLKQIEDKLNLNLLEIIGNCFHNDRL